MKERLMVGVLVIALGLTGCGTLETAEAIVTTAAPTVATYEMSTTAETITETTATATTTTPILTETAAVVIENENFSDINQLFEALINKNEYDWEMGLNEDGYNYLIEKIDIDDYEVLEVNRTDPFYIPVYKIRVNVTRSEAPEFPIGERIWIYSTYEPNDFRDSENIRDYLWDIITSMKLIFV
jgi:hypothetical protein